MDPAEVVAVRMLLGNMLEILARLAPGETDQLLLDARMFWQRLGQREHVDPEKLAAATAYLDMLESAIGDPDENLMAED